MGQGRAVLENADKLASEDNEKKPECHIQDNKKTPVWEDSDDEGLK